MDRRRPLLALSWCIAIVGLIVLGAGCATSLPPAYVVAGQSDALYLLAEQAGTARLQAPADPADPEVPDTGGNFYDTKQATTAGVTNIVGRLQGQALPAASKFTVVVTDERWIDLDQSIIGTVYISNSLSAVSARAIEGGVFRVNLRLNGVQAGGMDFPLTAAAASTVATWVPIHFSFPPEFVHLAPGDSLNLEVTQLSGLADLRIGTGGNHQSHARLQTYSFDPLARAVYVVKSKLVFQTPDGDVGGAAFVAQAERADREGAFDGLAPGLYTLVTPGTPEVAGAGLALGGIFLAPLVWTGARSLGGRNARVMAIAALLVTVALAGCAGGKGNAGTDDSDLPPEARPSVEQSVQDLGDNGAEAGELAGTVRDWRNLTLKAAHVGVQGTSLFTDTDEAGRFNFTNVTEGRYVLRVDAKEMRSIEETVDVVAGKRTLVTIKMAPLDPSVPDKFSHVHDEWGGRNELLLLDARFTPENSKGYSINQPTGGLTMCIPWTDTAVDGRAADDLCYWPMPIPLEAKVPPGAGAVHVTLGWAGDATEMGISAYNPTARLEVNGTYLPRGKGETTRITFFPNEADPGHQGFSNWVFDVFVPASAVTTFGQQPLVEVGEVTVKATAIRTVVPFEPGHPDLWFGENSIHMFDDATVSYTCTNCPLPSDTYKFAPPKGMFIPPDTARIEGTFKVSRGNAGETAAGQTFSLLYKPANVPAGRWSEGLKPIPLQGSFPDFTFDYAYPRGETDQPYQSASNLFFYPTSDFEYPYRGSITFTLDLTVHKA